MKDRLLHRMNVREKPGNKAGVNEDQNKQELHLLSPLFGLTQVSLFISTDTVKKILSLRIIIKYKRNITLFKKEV